MLWPYQMSLLGTTKLLGHLPLFILAPQAIYIYLPRADLSVTTALGAVLRGVPTLGKFLFLWPSCHLAHSSGTISTRPTVSSLTDRAYQPTYLILS